MLPKRIPDPDVMSDEILQSLAAEEDEPSTENAIQAGVLFDNIPSNESSELTELFEMLPQCGRVNSTTNQSTGESSHARRVVQQDDSDDSTGGYDSGHDLPGTVLTYPNSTRPLPAALLEHPEFRRTMKDQIRQKMGVVQSTSAVLFSYDKNDRTPENMHDTARIRYLPFCPSENAGFTRLIDRATNLLVLPSHRSRIDKSHAAGPLSRLSYPPQALPVELFELVTAYLSRDDVKSMRLVNKEFEQKVSRSLFHTSVVPFNTELYDMIEEDTKTVNRIPEPKNDLGTKGKQRARNRESLSGGLHWQNAKEDAEGKVYKGHGLRVFQGFGPHISRFGMSFEVSEPSLARTPVKRELDQVASYHGSYNWPPPQYTRFANLAGLERTADDTMRMKAAFSNLSVVQELALSIDSGLGWLNGPDQSLRSRLFQSPSRVFGPSKTLVDDRMQEAADFWTALQQSHQRLGLSDSLKEVMLQRTNLSNPVSEISGIRDTPYADTRLWSSIAANRLFPDPLGDDLRVPSTSGVLFTTLPGDQTKCTDQELSPLCPASLKKEQREWLLETEWAQRAFLECYVLAIVDNPAVFARIRTLNIAKISSGFLPLLGQEQLWNALPALTNVTLLVKPDWRTVEKDMAGFAEATSINPSDALHAFYKAVLRDRICPRQSINTLKIGWVGGGEQGDGIFARNNHLLPAPINPLEHTTTALALIGILFKHVEHLTLSNCWMTPATLQNLIKHHAEERLKKLTLESVSLTSHPRFPSPAAGQPQLVNQQQAAIAALNAQNIPANANNQAAWLINAQQAIAGNQQPLLNNPAIGNNNNINNANNNAAAPGGGPLQPVIQNPGNANQLQMFQQQLFNIPPNPVPASPLVPWHSHHREGSWPDVLTAISPGPILRDYQPPPKPWEEPHPERPAMKLETIEFISCGYAKLINHAPFDQFAMEAPQPHTLSPWFRARQAALSASMMTTSDRYTAKIVQYIPPRELNTLMLAWGLREGWDDSTKAEESEHDGMLPGGTGRFSGRVEKSMGLRSEVTTD